MAKNQPLLKKTRMPPTAPRVPKNPVITNPKPRAPARLRVSAVCDGGPLHAQRLIMPFYEPTIVFSLRGQRGRYKPTGERRPVTGKHMTIDVSVYEWEAA